MCVYFLPVCRVSVSETAIVASMRRSYLLKRKNGATVSGIICFSVRLNHTDKAALSSGPAGHCSLIIYWHVHRVISWGTAQYYTVLKAFFLKSYSMDHGKCVFIPNSSMMDTRVLTHHVRTTGKMKRVSLFRKICISHFLARFFSSHCDTSSSNCSGSAPLNHHFSHRLKFVWVSRLS